MVSFMQETLEVVNFPERWLLLTTMTSVGRLKHRYKMPCSSSVRLYNIVSPNYKQPLTVESA